MTPSIENVCESETTSPIICMRGVTKAFASNILALDSIDLDVASGEFFSLLGPSGCGKTTLLRMLAGLDKPDAGTISISGELITRKPPEERSVNTVFQSYALFPHLTVRDNIGFGLKMRGFKKSAVSTKVEGTAKFIKCDDLLDRHIGQLSGGEQQRVALARALVNEPEVLLLDESLSALDAGLRRELQVELLRIQRELGITFVFVTHDQHEAMVMSDRIAVLNDGKIQQIDTPFGVYEHPSNRFVAQFMGHENLFRVHRHEQERVITDLGVFKGRFNHGTHMLVRPETVKISSETKSHSTDNQFPAAIQQCLYRGSIIEYRLICEDSSIMALCTNTGKDQSSFQKGDKVAVSIANDSVAMLNG